jgi:hypothetical protein
MKPINTNQFEPIGIGKRVIITNEEEVQSVDQNTGELFYMKKLAKSKEVAHDSLTYTKVFNNRIEDVYSMSIGAYKLFLYCIYNIQPNRQTIVLDPTTCMKECNMKRTSYFAATKELKQRNVIKQKEMLNCEYYINPNVLFNGNRLRIYK